MTLIERKEPLTLDEVMEFVDSCDMSKADAHQLKQMIADIADAPEKKKDDYDYINPTHYRKDGHKESIEEIEDRLGFYGAKMFCFGSAMKYLYRRGLKPEQSIKRENSKVRWYLDRILLYDRNELAEMDPEERRLWEELAHQMNEVKA